MDLTPGRAHMRWPALSHSYRVNTAEYRETENLQSEIAMERRRTLLIAVAGGAQLRSEKEVNIIPAYCASDAERDGQRLISQRWIIGRSVCRKYALSVVRLDAPTYWDKPALHRPK